MIKLQAGFDGFERRRRQRAQPEFPFGMRIAGLKLAKAPHCIPQRRGKVSGAPAGHGSYCYRDDPMTYTDDTAALQHYQSTYCIDLSWLTLDSASFRRRVSFSASRNPADALCFIKPCL